MPFVANTPESLLGRSDSKDPNSTCRGITSAGRPCRRAVTNPQTHLLSRPKTPDLADETLYCWQHKEQAIHSHSARSSPGPKGTLHPITERRSSLDTLADRLGLVRLDEKRPKPKKHRHHDMRSPDRYARKQRNQRQKPAGQLEFCLCFKVPIDEVPESPRPRPMQQLQTLQTHQYASAAVPQFGAAATPPRTARNNASPSKYSTHSQKSSKSNTSTGHFKNFIPDGLDATTASTLMAELAKPHTDAEEPGFIYMFWLTPESQPKAPVDAARAFLQPPQGSRPDTARRPSDTVSRFASQATPGRGKKTMLLKIGRAANVQRRMNQWQRQCGYDVEVLRYYPQFHAAQSSATLHTSVQTPTPTPHCRRVERLIHIELSGMGLRAERPACHSCGREHREWFEIEASRDSVRRVDEVIRRWVTWDTER